ncbi:MAG: bifunctional phosphopantothenoylcysteine decarboxylase/phosphopantothenate--cysteine ligase CoaBC [Bacteroidales bacterium]|jgi:phosphopantothenoylcysteine decarboxylase/phosphopantothenate--cysteine ligase
MLKNKKIIVGISGSIAAYKAAYLIRLFIKEKAEVKVVTTKNALQFITKLTLETLSHNKIYSEVFDEQNNFSTEHITLSEWADIFVVAPASANIIGKFANGIADDALSTSLLAFNKKIFIAPAMNSEMLKNFAVKQNIKYLKDNEIYFVEPVKGELACGTEGEGRMEEPEKIVEAINKVLQ